MADLRAKKASQRTDHACTLRVALDADALTRKLQHEVAPLVWGASGLNIDPDQQKTAP